MTEKTLTVGTAQPNFAPELKQPGESARLRTRRRLFMALGIFAGIAATAYLATRWFAPPSEETDDAYVGGNIVAVTARKAGTVLALHADNTQRVLRGQPLIELDPAMANVQLDAAEAAVGGRFVQFASIPRRSTRRALKSRRPRRTCQRRRTITQGARRQRQQAQFQVKT
jgi:membrane fusion protein, multidrug efflux system